MGGSIGGAAAMGIGAIQGAQQQKKIKNTEKNRGKKLLDVQGQMFGNIEAAGAEQYANILKANKASQAGYGEMVKDADRIEGEGVKQSKQFFQQALGGADASASSRGMLGSSVNTNQRLGAARQASRYMTDAQIAASKLRTSARLGLGQAQAQGFQALGQFHAYKANQKNNVLGAYFDFLSNQQFGAQQPQAGNLAGLASQFGQYKTPGTV